MQRAPPAQPIHGEDGCEKQGRFRTKERTEANDETAEKPTANGAKKVDPLSDDIELLGRGE